MKGLACLAAVLVCLVVTGEARSQVIITAVPARVVAIVPAPVIPVQMQLQPIVTYRWGLFGRRIVPRIYWVPVATQTDRGAQQ